MDQFDRRSFLRLGGIGLAGIVFAPVLAGCDDDNPIAPETLAGFAPFITPRDQFFQQFGGRDTIEGWEMPTLTRDDWRLELTGEFLNPLTLSWSDLASMSAAGKERTLLKTMQCILDSPLRPGSTGLTGNAYWTGIPLRHVLELAQLDPDNTRRLVFTGADGFNNNVKQVRVTGGDQGAMDILLAYKMNGQDLTREHGGPVRLIIPEMYGYKNIKWLTEINASIFDRPVGQYQREGFIDDGVIRPNSRSENMKGDITVAAGLVEITGYAVSGYDGIARVEISVDGGQVSHAQIDSLVAHIEGTGLPAETVQLATQMSYPFPAVWAKWRYRWEASHGDHTVSIRAVDLSGRSQPDEDLDLKDGQTGVVHYHVKAA
jgi:DMSO/TMAO reductase YedYZ molybdopterin-dependent catalytic subunit